VFPDIAFYKTIVDFRMDFITYSTTLKSCVAKIICAYNIFEEPTWISSGNKILTDFLPREM